MEWALPRNNEMMTNLQLVVLSAEYSICRFPPTSPTPSIAGAEFVSITRTPNELSVVCPRTLAPEDCKREDEWRGFVVAGTLDFELIGVIASLTKTLAESHISVFVVSSFDTDYLFVKSRNLPAAIAAFRESGYDLANA